MIARINQVVLSLSLTALMGFAFTPVGCGGSTPPAVSVPQDADLTRQLRACAAEHEGHLGYAPRSMSFDVELSDAGYVESIALRDESFRDEDLEACMVHALRSLTIDDLPMRLSGGRPRGPVAPESRAFVGQIPLEIGLEACLASSPCALTLGLIVGASFIAVTVYVYVNTKPSLVRPRPPVTLATSMPTATAVPTTTAPPVPITQVETDEEKKKRCKKVKDMCIAACVHKFPTTDFGFQFWNCVNACMADEGCTGY